MTTLIHFDAARAALEKATSIDEVKEIRDKAEALRLYLRQQGEGLDMQNQCAEIRLRAERRAGGILSDMEKNKGGNPNLTGNGALPVEKPPTLSDLGISKNQSSRFQKVADVPEEDFEEHIAVTKDAGKELTTASLLKTAHVSHNAGEHEWYTPPEYIKAARQVLGVIDLDPASSRAANQTVKASQFYSADDDGLSKSWRGRVWMNPPYSQPLIGQFVEKLALSIEQGSITSALVLVNNATETVWFQRMASASAAICFPRGRVRFLDEEGKPGAPLQGQAVLYFGGAVDNFQEAFADFGFILTT